MKILIFISFCVLVSAEFKVKHFSDLMRFHNECGAETNTPAEILLQYKKDIYTDEKAYCHVKCVAKKIGVMNEQNEILKENLVEQVAQANGLNTERSREVVTKCMNHVDQFKDDSCLMSFEGLKCLFQHNYGLVRQGDVGENLVHEVSAEFTVTRFPDLMRYHNECGAENNTPAETLIEYKKEVYTDEKAFCHVKCVARKIGVLNEQNELLKENLVKQVAQANCLNTDRSREVVTKCMNHVDQFKYDSCLMSFEGLKCLLQQNYGLVEQGNVGPYL